MNNNKEHVPMGKAIAIILAVVVGGAGLIGGIFFFALSDGSLPNVGGGSTTIASGGGSGSGGSVVELTSDNIHTYLNINVTFSNLDTRTASGIMGMQERVTTSTMTVNVEPRRNVEFSNASFRILLSVRPWGNQEEFTIHLPFDGRTSTSRDISTNNVFVYGDTPSESRRQFTLVTGEVTYN